MTGSSQEATKLVASLVKGQPASIDVELNIDLQDTSNFVRQAGPKDYEANYLGPWAGNVVPSGFLEVCCRSQATARNCLGYANASFDKIVEERGRTVDPAKRKDWHTGHSAS